MYRNAVALAALAAAYSSLVAAEENPYMFAISPNVAYVTGGSFDEAGGNGRVELNDSNARGLIFNMLANPNGQYELLYSRQSTDADTEGFLPGDPTIDIDIEHVHLGGTYLFDGETTRPFVALTLGLSRYDPGLTESRSENFFSASLSGGVQLFTTSRLGARLEARVFATFVDDDSELFCQSDAGIGACLLRVEASTVTQWEARAGLVFRF